MFALLKKIYVPTAVLAWAIYYMIDVADAGAKAIALIKPVFIFLVVLYLAIVIREYRALKAALPAEDSPPPAATAEQKKLGRENWLRVGVCFLATVVYLAVINHIGFIVSTVIYLFGLFWYLKAKNRVAILVAAVALAVAMYMVFDYFLGVPLPKGFLI